MNHPNKTLDKHLPPIILRPATEADQPQIIELIDGVFHEYDDRVCLTGGDADLLDLHSNYAARGGEFVVMEVAGRVIASHAFLPIADRPQVCTFRRLYLHADFRGQKVGERLMMWAIEGAAAAGFNRVEFWSDTRFTRAHRFFKRLGFQTDGTTIRTVHDGYTPYDEYFFYRPLGDAVVTKNSE
jgi:putative acetyltransferase